MGYPESLRTKQFAKGENHRAGLLYPAAAFSPTRTSKRWWTPTISGSWSAPASASATSPTQDMATSDMAIEAAKCALAQRGIDASELDAIIVCTVTPDMFFPSTACLVQNGIGAQRRLGLRPDRGLLRFRLRLDHRRAPGGRRHAQESAGDRRRHHEPHHRLHRPRHLRPVRRRRRRHADRTGAKTARTPASSISWAKSMAPAATTSKCPPAAAACPPPTKPSTKRLHFVHQEGQQVFKYAVRKMYESLPRPAGAQRSDRRRYRAC